MERELLNILGFLFSSLAAVAAGSAGVQFGRQNNQQQQQVVNEKLQKRKSEYKAFRNEYKAFRNKHKVDITNLNQKDTASIAIGLGAIGGILLLLRRSNNMHQRLENKISSLNEQIANLQNQINTSDQVITDLTNKFNAATEQQQRAELNNNAPNDQKKTAGGGSANIYFPPASYNLAPLNDSANLSYLQRHITNYTEEAFHTRLQLDRLESKLNYYLTERSGSSHSSGRRVPLNKKLYQIQGEPPSTCNPNDLQHYRDDHQDPGSSHPRTQVEIRYMFFYTDSNKIFSINQKVVGLKFNDNFTSFNKINNKNYLLNNIKSPLKINNKNYLLNNTKSPFKIKNIPDENFTNISNEKNDLIKSSYEFNNIDNDYYSHNFHNDNDYYNDYYSHNFHNDNDYYNDYYNTSNNSLFDWNKFFVTIQNKTSINGNLTNITNISNINPNIGINKTFKNINVLLIESKTEITFVCFSPMIELIELIIIQQEKAYIIGLFIPIMSLMYVFEFITFLTISTISLGIVFNSCSNIILYSINKILNYNSKLYLISFSNYFYYFILLLLFSNAILTQNFWLGFKISSIYVVKKGVNKQIKFPKGFYISYREIETTASLNPFNLI